jgi:hypothetical protein
MRTTEEESGMKIVVAHHSTQQKVMGILDGSSDKLLAGDWVKNVQIVDQKKSWLGPVMTFSFTGQLGYISVPLAGTFTVDETNVTLECELPPLVKNFIGEDKFRAMMEANVRAIVAPGN